MAPGGHQAGSAGHCHGLKQLVLQQVLRPVGPQAVAQGGQAPAAMGAGKGDISGRLKGRSQGRGSGEGHKGRGQGKVTRAVARGRSRGKGLVATP